MYPSRVCLSDWSVDALWQARREYLQKKEEDVQKKEQLFRDSGLANDADQELFGTASNEEVLSDDSQTKNQPFTGQCLASL